MQIGLQTFTIRKDLKNKSSIKSALEKIKNIGINSIEIARIPFDKKTVTLVNDICLDLDIKIRASQFKLKELTHDIKFTIETHKLWNCELMAVSVIPLTYLLRGLNGFKDLSNELNSLGEITKKEGIQLLYHHHHFEFAKYIGKGNKFMSGFDVLRNSLNSESVKFILDTYWLQRSGYNPAKFISDLSNDAKVVHLRDYTLNAGIIFPKIQDTFIGNGTIDFSEVITACKSSGIAQLSIEQSSKNPYHDLVKSVEQLRIISMDQYL